MGNVEYSVIVPVYNVEKVLSRCIESILSQTFSNFELILIDDGSTDKSGEICDEYKKKDERVKVIHQNNQGVSKARNVGLDISKGKYIVFIDSDDCVEINHLEQFGKVNSDLIITGFWLCKQDYSIINEFSVENKEYANVDENVIIQILKSWYSHPVCAKRFKRKIIDENGMRFIEECSYGEDAIFFAMYLEKVKDIIMQTEISYRYFTYDNFTLSKINKDEKFKQNAFVLQAIYNIFSEKEVIKEFLLNKYWWVLEKEIRRIFKSHDKTSDEKATIIVRYLNENLSERCLNCEVTSHVNFLKKIIYKSKNKTLNKIWIKIEEIIK